jgi:type I restriction-modification system DNA methylase subunit
MTTPFETYISKVETDLRGGKATEHTYRGTLEFFMESLEHGIAASNDPKHIECGAPDFIVEKRKVPLGYVETKDVGEPLDKIEKSDQLKRYLKALNNLILTDYLEFRWYVNGEKKRTVRLAEIGKNNRLVIHPQAEANITQLFGEFYATETPTVRTAKELAGRLAGVTHFIRDRIFDVLTSGEPSIQQAFAKRFAAFKDLLLPALKEEEFADLYAQTMTYGLFAAKLSAPATAEFTLTSAYQYLFGNKFLRRLFSDVSEELDEIEIIRPYLLDIISLLNRARFEDILADFGKRTRTEDPVVHFYETFLATYDPKLRASRGVFYTPEPAVQFIVNAVDYLLKSRFNLSWGLADSSVKVLDPATGTGTFLYYVIQKIYDEVVTTRKQAGQWKQKSKELLNRIFGFELLIAPYVVSHLKLGLLLKTLDAPLEGNEERLHVYLTNTLEEGVTRAEQLAGLGHYIAEEASDAAFVKKNQEIMVVMGNPPYSNFGMMNKSEWIMELLEDYKKGLNERKINLDDDFIKFIRFGQWRIDQTGQGILAFITSNTFIDGITHRQMRKSLLETFSDIYILDLHGSSKKKEKSPDGSKDENIFDIQQGVSINIFVKEKGKEGLATVHHAELWGSREHKYNVLHSSEIPSIEWQSIQPLADNYFFVPTSTTNPDKYLTYPSVNEIYTDSISGVQTKKDDLFVDYTEKDLETKIKSFLQAVKSSNSQRIKEFLETDDHWIVKKAKNVDFDKTKIRPYMLSPFDLRYVYYDVDLLGRARYQVMKHMIDNNIGFVFMRQSSNQGNYDHFLATNSLITDRVFFSAHGAPFLAPLYHYTTPEETAGTLFAQTETTRQPNLAPAFIQAVEEKLKVTVTSNVTVTSGAITPEDIFHYAYAVFHSPTYRTRYAEFLKIDFPRLPITSDKKLFRKLAEKGRELVELHLLKSSKVDDFVTTYPIAGDNKVEKVAFAKGNVWINAKQYFGKVPENVWEFKVGGYQVCEKWLKDRKGRVLSSEDITHYQRVVVALKETIRLMKEIDKSIVKWPME